MFQLTNWDFITLPMMLRYLINLLSVFILIRFIYFKNYKRSDLFLTFFGFNTIIFFITFVLNEVKMSTGAAFGLFAVFSILRYRTEGISAKDMTYLFLCIALGLITALNKGNLVEHIVYCVILILLTFILEGNFLFQNVNSKIIQYDNLSLVMDDRRPELLDELKKRTGLKIINFSISEINYLRDACTITIFYTK